jgi:uncharacterized membrane protein
MSDVPVQLIVAAFQEETAADQALKELKSAQKQKLIDIQDAAVIRRDEKNKLHIKETADPGGGKGAAAGGAIGAVIGLIAGPPGVVVGASVGALVGGVTAKVIDSGIPDDRLEKIGEGLPPGTSAIVAIIELRWVGDIEKQLADAGADVLTEALRDDIAEQLAAGQDVSFTAISSEEGMAAQRISVGEAGADMETVVVTDEGVAGEVIVATDEGVAVEEFVATDEGVVVVAAVADTATVDEDTSETEVDSAESGSDDSEKKSE